MTDAKINTSNHFVHQKIFENIDGMYYFTDLQRDHIFIILQGHYMDRVKRIWYLKPMQAAKVQASLRIRAVSPEPSLLAHTSSESRGTFR